MKTILSRVVLCGTLLVSFTSVYAQVPPQLNVIQPSKATLAALRTNLSTGSTFTLAGPVLTTWPYQFVAAQDGNTYSGTIVGGNPFNRAARTTTIPVVIIPLRLQFNPAPVADSTGAIAPAPVSFDPTSPDNGCLGAGNTALSLTQGSPIFTPAPYTINGINVGTTIEPDAIQRAAFWPQVSGFAAAYHLAFNVSVAAKQTISVTSGTFSGALYHFGGGCGTNPSSSDNPKGSLGLIDISYIDPALNTIISNLGITANQFPLFVIYSAVITENGASPNNGHCCILGYHGGSFIPAAPGQTYGIAEYDQGQFFGGTDDVSAMSHEVQEWINDPSGANPTPPWGNIGQVGGCQGNLEVGDPLSGTLMPPVSLGGHTYHTQELAFFSWFYGVPFAGAGGKYSSNGTFGGFAKPCPPGGTN